MSGTPPMRALGRRAHASGAVLVGLALIAVAALAGCEGMDLAPDDGAEVRPSPPPEQPEVPEATSPSPLPRVFDDAAMQDEVHRVLTEHFDVAGLDVVTCPPEQPVSEGITFTCTATIDGEEHDVPITVTDDDGAYTVGEPE
ncbi:DUF4333 domain-containing protein [Haloechinothrix sp. LS1_15]|uniref:DUF4333 domain-containing protein n=1 Tax=Haloechinothrix sp. LS1_15 TaxID=2652248 RepID=UPI0029456338|nr:DUF4333 domain-containing protein [Haloechinothrix sp. LS1_15]MDV6014001.1 DUF4333 domain-containing protein [Haloechinothrix sp. LS1_15]